MEDVLADYQDEEGGWEAEAHRETVEAAKLKLSQLLEAQQRRMQDQNSVIALMCYWTYYCCDNSKQLPAQAALRQVLQCSTVCSRRWRWISRKGGVLTVIAVIVVILLVLLLVVILMFNFLLRTKKGSESAEVIESMNFASLGDTPELLLYGWLTAMQRCRAWWLPLYYVVFEKLWLADKKGKIIIFNRR